MVRKCALCLAGTTASVTTPPVPDPYDPIRRAIEQMQRSLQPAIRMHTQSGIAESAAKMACTYSEAHINKIPQLDVGYPEAVRKAAEQLVQAYPQREFQRIAEQITASLPSARLAQISEQLTRAYSLPAMTAATQSIIESIRAAGFQHYASAVDLGGVIVWSLEGEEDGEKRKVTTTTCVSPHPVQLGPGAEAALEFTPLTPEPSVALVP